MHNMFKIGRMSARPVQYADRLTDRFQRKKAGAKINAIKSFLSLSL